MSRVRRIVPSVVAAVLLPQLAAAVESRICGSCHQDIYRRYILTPMGRSSGAVGKLHPGEFQAADGVEFRISEDSFSFRFEDEEIRRKLNYFIGAGVTGRSYLMAVDGFLFQAPISFYSSSSRWDLSPGYEKTNGENLLREVEPSCLNCHASGVRWKSGTVNGYEQPPFTEGGVSCERCHGPGDEHVTGIRAGKRVIPQPVERESVCAQCHLPGVVTIGRSVFVWEGLARESTVNGHYEQLARSRCALASGGKMWCGSCHDPHAPVPYNQRCLNCHAPTSCTATHKATNDCVACHMPRISAPTVAHATLTDHTIPRRPVHDRPSDVPQDARLKLYGGGEPSARDLGLAYAAIALRDNNRIWGKRAIDLLEASLSSGRTDAKVLTQLAQLLEREGREPRACELYAQAVAADPAPVGAAVNLGNCYANKGELAKSIPLWKAALSRSPGLEAARLNLAVALYRGDNAEAARAVLTEGLRFNPASRQIRALLREIQVR
ncbi:MAG: hypothetical protein JO022_20010 [Acidobacteriaceae bacterium]|nr:hypothetical protein [Acidobacteriaceae bacterium]